MKESDLEKANPNPYTLGSDMVIQIRGTSGSGKTWVMRQVMEYALGGSLQPQYVEGRKKPQHYWIDDELGNEYVVLGHYEATCGGCDNIGSAPKVFELIQEVERIYSHVVIFCEGLLLSEDSKWTPQMDDVRVLYLTTPVEKCIEQIKARREAAGNTKSLNESNTRNRVVVIERSRVKLNSAEVITRRCPSKQALSVIQGWIEDFQIPF